MDSELIQLVNRLQAACTQLGDYGALDNDDFSLFDSLPQIAVVGGQSAGYVCQTSLTVHLTQVII